MLLFNDYVDPCPGPVDNNTLDGYSKHKGMRILHQNILGLVTNFYDLCAFFDAHKIIDNLTLSETNFDDHGDLHQIPEYVFMKWNRKTGIGVESLCMLKKE